MYLKYLFVLFINIESLLVLIKLVDSIDVGFDRFVESKSNKYNYSFIDY